MLAFVSGLVAEKVIDSPRGTYVVVDSHGMGFEILTSMHSAHQIPDLGEPVRMYTALIVREDAMSLVGFISRDERDLFQILQTASGVGTKVALALLSSLSVSEIAQAIVAGDHKPLTAAKGVGGKLAQKMVLELKEKMSQWRGTASTVIYSFPNSEKLAQVRDSKNSEAFSEAESVLLSLGYHPEEIARSFVSIHGTEGEHLDKLSAELILRDSLRWLAQSV
jgi:holliday junction DNA helicase RuvA